MLVVLMLSVTLGGMAAMVGTGAFVTGRRDRATMRAFRDIERDLYPFLRTCDMEPTVLSPIDSSSKGAPDVTC